MGIYLVERHIKGIGLEQLAAAQVAAVKAGEYLRDHGRIVHYVRSTFVPAEGTCYCLFEADSGLSVRELNLEAHLPYRRIVEALDLTPPVRLRV
jgi:hypothetical protein